MSDDLPQRVRELEHGHAQISAVLPRLETTIGELARNLSQLTEVATRQEEDRNALRRAFSRIKDVELRMSAIEIQLPMLSKTSGWVIRIVEWVVIFAAGVGVTTLTNMIGA